jgi:hypothetical protein
MQVDGALQGGASTRPQRSRLHLLVAIVVIAAMVALLIWAAPFASSGVGAEDAKPNAGAGSAIIHDDAGNVHRSAGSAVIHDDSGYVNRD